jgi:hypothetical protein
MQCQHLIRPDGLGLESPQNGPNAGSSPYWKSIFDRKERNLVEADEVFDGGVLQNSPRLLLPTPAGVGCFTQ